MALIFGVHASRWKKYVWLIDGVPTEFWELTLKEDACFGPNPPIPTPLPTLEDLARGRKPVGAFVLAVDSPGSDPMTAFAISVLAVASRETMSTLYQVSTDWTFFCLTIQEQVKHQAAIQVQVKHQAAIQDQDQEEE